MNVHFLDTGFIIYTQQIYVSHVDVVFNFQRLRGYSAYLDVFLDDCHQIYIMLVRNKVVSHVPLAEHKHLDQRISNIQYYYAAH